ncbi:ATP-binding cassette domain-containing protein [Thermanaerosceptrum fracticalcis]|uniref:ATP-binding cassette domain-containing protein n=1 Tax=Thermanaerosceptrum fracticalcis TaxID=1712410 RepID=A0A7G6E7A6_THEFR|nr:ABC transporter ATP-binding protein [Thermanaerosceptrum fracticalcis]QNB47960.1 ATP-binding cassette domain-containing protein [Thermanaerosceptrum fracticalcis]
MLNMSNISKIYKTGAIEVIALNKINLTVEEGEFVAIVGPSGSGKSTLMNLIGCLDTPTQGEYWLDGHKVSKLSDDELADIRNLKIGFIFQGFNLLHKLSAVENVELPLIYRGMNAKERQERALRALTKVGLENRLHHKPSELSGGQQQRVAIARALAGDPPLILADEPTGNLDSVSGKEVLASLRELNQQGHTIVLITHDTQVAEKARRIIRIQDGSIVSDERMG